MDPRYPPNDAPEDTPPGRYDEELRPSYPWPAFPRPGSARDPFQVHRLFIDRLVEPPWSKEFTRVLRFLGTLSAAGSIKSQSSS